MIEEIAEYFNSCINGIVKTIVLPAAIIIIIIKHLFERKKVEK